MPAVSYGLPITPHAIDGAPMVIACAKIAFAPSRLSDGMYAVSAPFPRASTISIGRSAIMSPEAAGHAAWYSAFEWLSIYAPSMEVDTTDGYRPGLGQIVAFVNVGAEEYQ